MPDGEGYDLQSPEEIERARQEIEQLFGPDAEGESDRIAPSAFDKSKVLAKYAHLDPKKEVPTDLLEKTVLFYDANFDKFRNTNFVTVVDFKPRSDKYRFFLIDMTTGAVEKYHTTHGLHSDENRDGWAERFGNKKNSGKSSLGFVRVSEEYQGKFGRSIRLDGLSKTNTNLRARAVVVHGWDKVYEKDVIQGWSWGCITLDHAVKHPVIDRILGGSLMYVGVHEAQKKKKKGKAKVIGSFASPALGQSKG